MDCGNGIILYNGTLRFRGEYRNSSHCSLEKDYIERRSDPIMGKCLFNYYCCCSIILSTKICRKNLLLDSTMSYVEVQFLVPLLTSFLMAVVSLLWIVSSHLLVFSLSLSVGLSFQFSVGTLRLFSLENLFQSMSVQDSIVGVDVGGAKVFGLQRKREREKKAFCLVKKER